MLKRRLGSSLIAYLVTLLFVCQGTRVLAGTSGGISGTVIDITTKQALTGVKVSAASPSQTASGTTDAGGHFAFLNLAPDTYVVSVEAPGYQPISEAGLTVVADSTRVIGLTAQKELRTIGRVSTRAAGALVRPGTTADVYSVNSAQQQVVAAAGGGGNLNTAWSAMATVPGVAIAPGQSGYIGASPTLSIRGGDYDQIGYQIDGIPINRAFDNYPSGPASSLGQQELQVYTGAPPANAESEGISGYVNQVIRTGTSPGFTNLSVGDGGPAFYHKLSFEYGGASGNRRFSYYAGVGGYDQDFRSLDQYNGAGVSRLYGLAYGIPCSGKISPSVAPSCYNDGVVNNGLVQGPVNAFSGSSVTGRDNVVNLHYYFPHKDGSRDDLQALYNVNYVQSEEYSSTNDQGGAAYLTAIGEGVPTYQDGYNLNLPTGGFLPLANKGYRRDASLYYFPNTPTHSFGGAIDPNMRDGFLNDQAIAKLQFTKSLGSSAYFRVYGYTYYSDWLNTAPNANYAPVNVGLPGDYELSAHTRGVSFQLADQFNAQNLLQLGGDFTTSSVLRDNNSQFDNGAYASADANLRTVVGVLVNSKNPTNGICYSGGGVAVNCYGSPSTLNTTPGTSPEWATIGETYNGTVPGITATTCGTGPCQYLVVGNGQYATFNEVKPIFWGASLTDEFRPTPKLTINGGLRLDVYQYQGSDTSGGAARQFWYNAYNQEMCIDDATQLVVAKASTPAGACSRGYMAAEFQNPAGIVTQTYPAFQPRLGFTYSLNPNTVVRASYGRYAQPPTSAFEQYNFLQADAPATLYGVYGFQQYGFTTPNHPIPPAASNNYDLSLEHDFGNQLSLKLTPFIRKTQNQIENFYLNRATNFVSGLNVGNQTSEGFELEVDKGDFAREGLAAKLSFAYTHSYIKYNTLSNQTTVLTPVVSAIDAYNALTKTGGGAPCYTLSNVTTGAPGAPDPGCHAGSIANPYYNAPAQSIAAYSADSSSVPYSNIPAGVGLQAAQIGYPFVASLVLSERKNKFSVAPIVQLFAGQRYGDPLATNGINPAACTAALGHGTTGDPRYEFGTQAGLAYDAGTCGTLASIPNLQTGAFDGIGSFSEPAQLLLHLQFSYDVTKNFQLVANLANVVNTCFGGSSVPWKVSGACAYGVVQTGLGNGGTGNAYNPGQAIQPAQQYSYGPYWTTSGTNSTNIEPFGVYVNANFRV